MVGFIVSVVHDVILAVGPICTVMRKFGRYIHALACRRTRHKAHDIRFPLQDPKAVRMQIIVRDNNVDQALRALKKKLQREGVYREMKLRRHYEKPSERRARERAAAISRARKADRKRAERDR